MFFTWVACSRNQRPSATFGLNQSIARPSFVQTCFRFPIDIAFAAETMASSAVTPEAIDVVVFCESLQQLRGVAGHDVHGSAGHITGVEELVEVRRDERIFLGRNRDHGITHRQQGQHERQET